MFPFLGEPCATTGSARGDLMMKSAPFSVANSNRYIYAVESLDAGLMQTGCFFGGVRRRGARRGHEPPKDQGHYLRGLRERRARLRAGVVRPLLQQTPTRGHPRNVPVYQTQTRRG